MALNKQQKQAAKYINEGHSILIHGSAGTGKTYLIQKVLEKIININKKNVYITATTGIACTNYNDAMTIHRWSGFGDGRYDQNEITEVICNNVKYKNVKQRIKETDILVIDEISMMSQRLFESLNTICQIKNPDLYFGGIQLIVAGDFRQLPPVPNTLCGDNGDFCFTSPLFTTAIPHRVLLTEVVRQSEAKLIQAITECSIGEVSQETSAFLETLKRPFPNAEQCTMLFATNDQVDDFNRKKIIEFPGQLYEFASLDSGDKAHLGKIIVPKCLWVKIGAPVILLRNIDKLVNGLKGEIQAVTEEGPVVRFGVKNVPITRMKCSVFSPSKNKDVAVREQYPLKLAFAITIHKAQGMTLDRVEVNCRGIFRPGQLAVALGRVRRTDGLRVTNFNKKTCLKQPVEVQIFMADERYIRPFISDLSCCNSRSMVKKTAPFSIITVEEMFIIEADLDINESETLTEDFDSEFDDVIRSIEEIQQESIDLPADIDLGAILKDLKCEHVVTTKQYYVNKILDEIYQPKYQQFVKNQYSKLCSFVQSYDTDSEHTQPISSQKQTEFYSKVHTYQTSAEFRMNCMSFFENVSFTEEHLHICFNISNAVRKYILKKKAEVLSLSNKKVTNRTVTNAALARIRYVGGYVVAKIHIKCMDKKNSFMYKTDSVSQDTYDEAVVCSNILENLRVEEQLISATTSQPASLLDVVRRQNQRRSLTNIADGLFQFFIILTESCLNLFVDENFNKHGQNIFEYAKSKIMKQHELSQNFSNVVKDSMATSVDIFGNTLSEDALNKYTQIIFEQVIRKYMMVMTNQFRKDLLEQFQITKKMSHRKQILVSSKKRKNDNQPSVSDTLPKKRQHIESPGPSSNLDSVNSLPGPSSSSDHDLPELNVEDDNDLCLSCHKHEKLIKGVQDDWIQCDSCNKWIHRACAGLKHHMKWKNAQKCTFFCYLCK